MSNSSVRDIREPRVYKVDKERSEQKIDEIEVSMFYLKGRGYRVSLVPQVIEDHGGYRMKSFDFWKVKHHDVISCKRFTKKSAAEAVKIAEELEPYWVAQMAASLGLVLEHDPIHGNW